eukprot:Gb_25399 [translate_table: standard]
MENLLFHKQTGLQGGMNLIMRAHGHDVYGPQYGESILEKIRHEVEPCESLQGFFMLHSLGGGTGSGLGSYVLELLHDVYPEIHRITTSVFPSADDDVVTSPYNRFVDVLIKKNFLLDVPKILSVSADLLLSVGILAEHADCVLPIENQALLDLLRALTSGIRALELHHSAPTFQPIIDIAHRFPLPSVCPLLSRLVYPSAIIPVASSQSFPFPTSLIPFAMSTFLVTVPIHPRCCISSLPFPTSSFPIPPVPFPTLVTPASPRQQPYVAIATIHCSELRAASCK